MRSRYGSVTIRARVTDAMKKGEVFATFHDPRVALNKLTSHFRDAIVGAPEYKVTAVSIAAVSDP